MENLNTIGNLLRTKREQQNISTQKMAEKTKINHRILKNLEDDNLEALPSRVYVMGFVKSYSKHLGISQEEALLSLDHTYEQKKVPIKSPAYIDLNEKAEIEDSLKTVVSSVSNKKIIIPILAILILFVVAKGVSSFLTQFSKEQVLITPELTKLKEDKATIKDKSSDLFDLPIKEKIRPKLEEAKAQPEAFETQVVAEQEKKVEEAAKLTESIDGKFPKKKFKPIPPKHYEIDADSPLINDPTTLLPQFKSAVAEGIQNVYIYAKDEATWISYKVDDKPIKRYVLKKGRRVLLKGDRIQLFMGNINGAVIFLNNQLVRAYSKTGVKSLVFPINTAKDYKLPLFPVYEGKPYTADEYIAKMQD